MKKKRICKCGSGKELSKGQRKCDDCNPKTKKGPVPRGQGPGKQPATGPAKASRDGSVITLDLGKRPDLYMTINRLAEENFRTVELQVLFMLTQIGGA